MTLSVQLVKYLTHYYHLQVCVQEQFVPREVQAEQEQDGLPAEHLQQPEGDDEPQGHND